MDPSERLTATQALNHQFFDGLKPEPEIDRVEMIRNNAKRRKKHQTDSPHE